MQKSSILDVWLVLANYYHKELHLGCCSSPRSASENIVHFPSGNHLLKLSNRNTRTRSEINRSKCNSKYTRTTSTDVTRVSLLLTVNIIHTLFTCLYCWFWTCNCQVGLFQDLEIHLIIYHTLFHMLPNIHSASTSLRVSPLIKCSFIKTFSKTWSSSI